MRYVGRYVDSNLSPDALTGPYHEPVLQKPLLPERMGKVGEPLQGGGEYRAKRTGHYPPKGGSRGRVSSLRALVGSIVLAIIVGLIRYTSK